MQDIFPTISYAVTMTEKKSYLRTLREKTGLSLRELSRIIGEQPTNLSYWERTGKSPRADLLVPIAKALGVTVEELLGEPKPIRGSAPSGKMRQLFESASRLPRSQQQKVADILQPFIREHVAQKA
jgi:transcriptional regulator with XRE-family HTH domain